MRKRGLVLTFAVCLIVLVFISLLFLLNNFSFVSSQASNVTEDLNPDWIRDNPLYELTHDSSRGLIYFVGGGGSANGIFGVYNKSSRVLENLEGADVGGEWINVSGGYTPYTLIYNRVNKLVYFAGDDGFFGAYNRTSNTTVNLATSLVGDWQKVNEMIYDFNSSLIYWGSDYGIFGAYNATNNTNENLSNTDTGDWLLSGDTVNGPQIRAFAYDNNSNLIYLGGSKGKFGVYDRTSNVATDLSATDTGDWIGSTGVIQGLSYDSKLRLIYLVGGTSASKTIFGVYNVSSGITENLNATDPGNWIFDSSSYTLYDVAYNPVNGLVYLSGGGAGSVNVFGVYNRTSNITYDLREADIGDWIAGDNVFALTYNSNDSLIYLASEHGRFGAYNASSNTSENLKNPGDWISSSVLTGLVYDSNNKLVYFDGEDGVFGFYNRTSNTKRDLRLTDTNNWLGYAYLYQIAYDSGRDLIYLVTGNGNGMFGVYNRTANVTTDLSGTDPGDWLGSADLHCLGYDSDSGLVYLGGPYGRFGVYNRTTNVTYNLIGADTGDWIGTAAGTYFQEFAYDSSRQLLYLAGSNGLFGVYNRSLNKTEDLRGTDPGNWMGTGSNSLIDGLAYDSRNKLIYLGGLEMSAGNKGIFGVYNRSSNISTDLSATDAGDWIGSKYITGLAYDSDKDLVYMVGSNGLFGVYNRTAGVTEDLRETDPGDWIGTYYLYDVAYDSDSKLIYLVGNDGIFGVYNRTSNTTSVAEEGEPVIVSGSSGSPPPAPTTTTETIPTASPGSPAVVNVNSSNMGLTKLTVNVSQTVSNISITITKLNSTQGADLRISLGRNGALYEAYEINTTLSNSNISNVEINFKVNKTWLANQNRTVTSVRLYRYVNNAWTRITTTLTGQDSQYYYFSAVSPGFSTFVVFFGEFECDPGEKRCFENQAQLCLGNATWLVTEKCSGDCDNGECLETPFKFDLKILYFALGIVIVGLIVVFLLRRIPIRKNKSSKEVRSSLRHKQFVHRFKQLK